MGGEAHCDAGKKEREKKRAREEWMREGEREREKGERGGAERVSERGMDGWERERTERCSGQARDAWLESGQAHMRPSSPTHSTKRAPYKQQRTLSAGLHYIIQYGAVKSYLKEQSNIFRLESLE